MKLLKFVELTLIIKGNRKKVDFLPIFLCNLLIDKGLQKRCFDRVKVPLLFSQSTAFEKGLHRVGCLISFVSCSLESFLVGGLWESRQTIRSYQSVKAAFSASAIISSFVFSRAEMSLKSNSCSAGSCGFFLRGWRCLRGFSGFSSGVCATSGA